jgi:hypothetical protein
METIPSKSSKYDSTIPNDNWLKNIQRATYPNMLKPNRHPD